MEGWKLQVEVWGYELRKPWLYSHCAAQILSFYCLFVFIFLYIQYILTDSMLRLLLPRSCFHVEKSCAVYDVFFLGFLTSSSFSQILFKPKWWKLKKTRWKTGLKTDLSFFSSWLWDRRVCRGVSSHTFVTHQLVSLVLLLKFLQKMNQIFVLFYWMQLQKSGHMTLSVFCCLCRSSEPLEQGCPNSGLGAKRGPWSIFMRPHLKSLKWIMF